jgi:hypothetical protein
VEWARQKDFNAESRAQVLQFKMRGSPVAAQSGQIATEKIPFPGMEYFQSLEDVIDKNSSQDVSSKAIEMEE